MRSSHLLGALLAAPAPLAAAVLLAAAALLAWPAPAVAHAHLESTDPPAGATLDEPPSAVTLTFDDELSPDGSRFTVTDANGEIVGGGDLDLGVADRNVLRGEVTIANPGIYTVTWQIVAQDGHQDSGAFSFGYRADPEDEQRESHADDSEAAPDTAAALPRAGSPLALLGAMLLIAAGLLAAWRGLTRAGRAA